MIRRRLSSGIVRIFTVFLLCSLLTTAASASTDSAQEPGAKYVALTFDDGPSGPITESLLQVLDRHQVPATFFLCGYRIEQFPQVVQDIAQAGHEIGTHGYSHDYLNNKSQSQIHKELTESVGAVTEITGQAPVLFRPPGGLVSDTMKTECQTLGLPIVLWSIDPEDWRCKSACAVADRVLSKTRDGSIILMHDLYRSSVEAADIIIAKLLEQGYTFLTVSQLAQVKCSTLEPGQRYFQLEYLR